VDSGRQLDLSDLPGVIVDKHSTGGVGDKTTLVLVPLVASMGVPIVKFSGRGLGFTGGTLDKLEAIPGLRTELSEAELRRQAREIGCVIAGLPAELAPADKRIYAIRDTTATVESLPLIASSVLSKKLAAGAAAFVFDVKCGRGAMLPDESEATALAALLNDLALRAGRCSTALLTSMEQPLGQAVGNALEVAEAIGCLRGQGPADLTELCLALGAEMVVLGGRARTLEEARSGLETRLQSGEAAERFGRMVTAQSGDATVLEDPSLLPRAAVRVPVPSPGEGFLTAIDARAIGEITVRLGAGRSRPGEAIDTAVGVRLFAKVGAAARRGEPIAEVHAPDEDAGTVAACAVAAAMTLGPEPPPALPLILKRLAAQNGVAGYLTAESAEGNRPETGDGRPDPSPVSRPRSSLSAPSASSAVNHPGGRAQ
jgi:pyrimidine-nucleoside phosphorylase